MTGPRAQEKLKEIFVYRKGHVERLMVTSFEKLEDGSLSCIFRSGAKVITAGSWNSVEQTGHHGPVLLSSIQKQKE